MGLRQRIGAPRAFVTDDDDALDRPAPPRIAAFTGADGPERLAAAMAAHDAEAKAFEERYEAFLDSGDLADCPLREGGRPTVFWIAPMGAALAADLDSAAVIHAQKAWGTLVNEVLATAIESVVDFIKCERKDGKVTETYVTFRRGDDGRLPKECLDLLLDNDLRSALIQEVRRARRLSPAARKSDRS